MSARRFVMEVMSSKLRIKVDELMDIPRAPLKLVEKLDKVCYKFNRQMYYTRAVYFRNNMANCLDNPLLRMGVSSFEGWLELKELFYGLIGEKPLPSIYRELLKEVERNYSKQHFTYDVAVAMFATLPDFTLIFQAPFDDIELLGSSESILGRPRYLDVERHILDVDKLRELLPRYEYLSFSPLTIGSLRKRYGGEDFSMAKIQDWMHLVPTYDLIETYQEFLEVKEKYYQCVVSSGEELQSDDVNKLSDKVIMDAVIIKRLLSNDRYYNE